ncbi:pentatricopeptide repeat-containing protein [Tripterygium wilfordii]|uniref:Pentatricopeptide repeat-containing protein n=2 Tax=Tripterygium wilfordii TaxID=458696 RepID=A0A7J7DV24_TRIWF|nr:pentatricopeptide repeat-containing protein [Tripterygium wilfordii]
MSRTRKIRTIVGGTLLSVLDCHEALSLSHVKQIHSIIVTFGLSKDTFLLTKLINFCTLSPQNDLAYATHLFGQIKGPGIHLWNSMIRYFSTSTQQHGSLVCYARMRQDGVFPDKHTFPLLLKAFSKLRNENPLQFYAHIVKFGWESDCFVGNSLISAFVNSGCLDFARQVFAECPQKDVVTWTAIIDGHVRNGCAMGGLRCFVEMISTGMKVDEVTVVSVLSGAGMVRDIWFGRCIHGFYVEQGRVKWDVYVGSALVDMYSKSGYSDDASKVFYGMRIRNVVSWTTLIAGYVQCNRFRDALLVYQEMLMEAIKPNHSTLTSVLTACAQLGAVAQGRWIHGYIYRKNLEINLALGTALIDMYAKCGCLDEALLIFEKLPSKDICTWTAMINGLAMHGDASSSLNFFSNMVKNGIQPNEITFIGVLSACSHGGLVDEGRKFFQSMRHNYHLEPNVDNYGCMVDLLGRAGYLDEARKLIEDMPMKPTPGIWGALFGACMIHKDYKLGEYVGKHLINLQPYHSGRYTLLANLYSRNHRWDAAAHIRKLMKGKGIGKIPGVSWIELNGVIHEFTAFDKSHSESSNIFEILDAVMVQLKPLGCIIDDDDL